MAKRPNIPKATETAVLTKSRRRCCLCFHLDGDDSEKPGQIAHLNHDPANNDEENLAWLCLPHHDRYDSRTSQSKGLTIEEVKEARAALYAAIDQRAEVGKQAPPTGRSPSSASSANSDPHPPSDDTQGSPKVFIAYASEDVNQARSLYQRLKTDGYEPWSEQEDVLPGQNTDVEVRKALDEAHVVLICVSARSADKRSSFHKQKNLALDLALQQPEGAVFVIPVKLDECELPFSLSKWRAENIEDENGCERLVRSLRNIGEAAEPPGAGDSLADPPPIWWTVS